jgi:hypothetical protein
MKIGNINNRKNVGKKNTKIMGNKYMNRFKVKCLFQ